MTTSETRFCAAVLLVASLAASARADDRIDLRWTLAEGDVFALSIDSERESRMMTAKDPIVTKFRMKVAADLKIDSIGPDGTAAVTLEFRTFTGVIAAFGFETPLDPEQSDVSGKSVTGTLTPRGDLKLDRKALKGVVEAHDISEEFGALFPVVPGEGVSVETGWAATVEDREEEWAVLGSSDGAVKLAGTCRADKQGDLGETKTSYVAKGTMSASVSLDGGHPTQVAVEWTEDSRLIGKDSRLETGMTLKRTVEVAKKPR
ncbi:MAG: hypothetical protein HUU15_03020 [Candidatus Brocadiae bacterium]|nr:hypothetical protein [Candidatus Brocadiia bacterium]